MIKRNKQMSSRFWLIFAAFLLLLPSISFAHPFHVSSTEMEWNAETKSFEVSIQIDPNDLEQELRRQSKRKIVLEKLAADDVHSNHPVFLYLSKVFDVTYNEQKLEVKPIGFEIDTKSAWIYFELPVKNKNASTDFESLAVINKMLIHQHSQTNHFLLNVSGKKISTSFHENTTAIRFYRNQKRELTSDRFEVK